MNPNERIQLNVKVPQCTADQIKRLAAANHLTVAEQLRQFIDKGLDIDGNARQIDFIATIIRQEFMAIYHVEDIKAVVEQLMVKHMEQQMSRIEKMQMKIGKVSAAGYFLLIKVLLEMAGKEDPLAFSAMVERAGKMGVEFMRQKNSTVNEILQDGIYACRMADEQLSN